ncbi:MAG: hypothetical protein IK066_04725 [Kiritimatiellae bacterium]|nr:hypothetical protein [Kiritimatiellia bacterium]
MSMAERWNTPAWRRGMAWGTTALSLWLLFWPFSHDGGSRRVEGFDKAIHVGLFGALTWAWGRVANADAARDSRRRWTLAGTLAAATLLVEVLQPLTGRSFDLWDSIAGCAGIVATTLLWNHSSAWLATALCAMALACVGRGLWNLGMEYRSFPTLAAGGGGCWAKDWALRGVEGESSPDGLRMIPARDGPVEWQGAFRVPMRTDWSQYGDWRLRVEWGGEEAAVLVVRLDDKKEKQPAYANRFQCEWRVLPGWNELSIPRTEWERTSGGGWLDTEQIARWGVFLARPVDFKYWTLGKTELEPLNERSAP